MNLHKEATLALASETEETYAGIIHSYAAKHPKSFIDSAAKWLRLKGAEVTTHRINYGKVALETLGMILNGAPYWKRELCYMYAAKHPKSFLMVVRRELFLPKTVTITLRDDGPYHFCETVTMTGIDFEKCKAACLESLAEGRKIAGIVKVRAISQLGLKEAKTFYEMVEKQEL